MTTKSAQCSPKFEVPDWSKNGLNSLCFVCAGRLCDFFDCATTRPQLRSKNPFYTQQKLKVVRLLRKWCQSFALRLCWLIVLIFFDFATPPLHPGCNNPSYMERKLKMMRLVRKWCQSFTLRLC